VAFVAKRNIELQIVDFGCAVQIDAIAEADGRRVSDT
jgi:hypothetical protein